MKKRVLVVSSASIDLSLHMSRLPNAGETIVENSTFAFGPGGKGANSALAFAKLGGESVFCTCLGDDSHGESLLSLYKKSGINTDFLSRVKDTRTGFAAVMIERAGQNRIVVYPGANHMLTRADVDRAFSCNPDALYMQFELKDDIVIYAAAKARRLGVPIFIDAGPARADFPLDSLGECEIFSPNESETYAFTGIIPKNEQSCLDAVDKLKTLVKSKYYVLKLGDRGAFISDGKIFGHSDSFLSTAVDTTAAGDAFTAALVLRYLEDSDIMSAAIYANAVGAITVSRAGPPPPFLHTKK